MFRRFLGLAAIGALALVARLGSARWGALTPAPLSPA